MKGNIGESVINDIDWDLRCANLRICLYRKTERGKGIGTWVTEVTHDFAFEELHLHRLELDVYSFDPGAEKVYLRAGSTFDFSIKMFPPVIMYDGITRIPL